MKKSIVICCIIFLLLQLFKGYLISDYAKDYGEKRIEIALDKESKIPYREIALSDEYNTYYPILSNRIEEAKSDIGKPTTIIGTTAAYSQLEHIRMVEGAFWGTEAVEEERNVAVISDRLAISLLGSNKASGTLIHLNGKVYEVVGVYQKYHRIRDYIMDDGYEKIYVPITSAAVKDLGVQFAAIDETYLQEKPDNEALQKLGLTGTISSQETWNQECKSIGQIPVITVWLLYMVIGGVNLYRAILMKKQDGKKLIIAGLIYVIGAGLLFKCAFTGMYIKPDALPQENIFDTNFYWKAMQAEWARHNYFLARETAHFEQALYLLKRSLRMMNILQFVLILEMVLKSRNRRAGLMKLNKEAR